MNQNKNDLLFHELVGVDLEEISRAYGLNPDLNKSKARLTNVANRMVESVKDEVEHLRIESGKLELAIRTINLTEKGRPMELTPLDTIDFLEWIEKPWEESQIYRRLKETLFVLLTFRTDKQGRTIFIGDKLWSMAEDELQGPIKQFWRCVKETTEEGIVITPVQQKNRVIMKNNLPKQQDNKILHAKTKGSNAAELCSLPDGRTISKQGYWFNSRYIMQLVKDIHERETIIRTKKEGSRKNLGAGQAATIQNALTEDGYAIDDFIDIIRRTIPSYDKRRLTATDAELLGYRVDDQLAVRLRHPSSTAYLEHLIFSNDYVRTNQHSVFRTNMAGRLLKNLERHARLILLDKGFYITDRCLSRAGVSEKDISHYREAVESYVFEGDFFTLGSLRKSGFTHPLEELGFEDMFYESILLRVGVLKSLRVGKSKVFIKTLKKPHPDSFIEWLMGEDDVLSMEELQSRASSLLAIFMAGDDLITMVNRSNHHYSKEFEKFYSSHDVYLDSIYE
ncbi:hypothetical protein RCC94_15290 [Exiguobacterium acetylicum]|uniref:hypothetical protein n=1 Tax=Exiguobacterium acetylicum TaxID=41170 RepID=UPI0027E17625|nr:hypothetical protein [Exiguobacterium acetylicum]MDQ6468862.1 hypothetical protein [Exiguobacterium acetylicum]